ncbi:MAG: DUF2497 domain-containing protein [Hyphomicrobiaceae bacterium]
MNKPDKAGEPSMDEILSSIRKIISEEPIGSGTVSASQESPRDSLGDVRMGDGLLGVVADEPSLQKNVRREPTLPSAGSSAASGQTANGNANGNDGVRSEALPAGGRGIEPKLPMPSPQEVATPQESPAAGRSLLSSRLAKVLGGTTTPSSATTTPPAETFDDEDLSAVLDAAALDVAAPQVAQAKPAEVKSDTADDDVEDVKAMLSVELDKTSPASPAEKTPDPFADLGNVSVVASTQAEGAGVEVLATTDDGMKQDKTEPESSVAKSAQNVASGDAARGVVKEGVNGSESRQPPLFESGPQPPSSLRPRAFETSELTSFSDADATEADTQTETVALQPDVASEANHDEVPMVDETPTVIASMEKPIEHLVAEAGFPAAGDPEVAPTEPASKSSSATTELVGLAAAVAAQDSTHASDDTSDPSTAGVASSSVPEPTVEAVAEESAVSDVSAESGVASSPSAASAASGAQAMELAAAAAKDPEVTASISPAGVQTLEDTVAELLRPMLREWLSNNMPRIVEKALRIELASGLSDNINGSDTAQIETDTSKNG